MAKLNKIWKKAIIYYEVKGKRNTKEIYMDKLFDILNWECSEIGAHIPYMLFYSRDKNTFQ